MIKKLLLSSLILSYFVFSSQPVQAELSSKCESLDFLYSIAYCQSKMAIDEKDISRCSYTYQTKDMAEKVFLESSICRTDFGLHFSDPSVCELLEEGDDCWQQFALDDISYCSRIRNQEAKDDCFYELSENPPDCGHIADEYRRNECLEGIPLRLSSPQSRAHALAWAVSVSPIFLIISLFFLLWIFLERKIATLEKNWMKAVFRALLFASSFYLVLSPHYPELIEEFIRGDYSRGFIYFCFLLGYMLHHWLQNKKTTGALVLGYVTVVYYLFFFWQPKYYLDMSWWFLWALSCVFLMRFSENRRAENIIKSVFAAAILVLAGLLLLVLILFDNS